MVTLKNKKATEKERAHTDVNFNNTYIGYIIKESKDWYFVNDSDIKELDDTSKGYFSSITGATKQSLIDQIINILSR